MKRTNASRRPGPQLTALGAEASVPPQSSHGPQPKVPASKGAVVDGVIAAADEDVEPAETPRDDRRCRRDIVAYVLPRPGGAAVGRVSVPQMVGQDRATPYQGGRGVPVREE